MRFFTSLNDLKNWVLGNGNPETASNNIIEVIGSNDDLSVKQACQTIFDLNTQIKKEGKSTRFDKDIEEASENLFVILSRYNITEIKEEGFMNKKTSQINNFSIREAQVTRPPSSPYTGREDDNKYVGTPWRKDRDAIYDFTHRNPDMLSFDDDPNHVYSGEALWRRYVMDKFYRDYKDDKGRVVGGYINDRFKVYHDLGGNQMELANGERTRKPRPHQYSIERRLQEARNEKTEDILPLRAAADGLRVIITGSENNSAKDSDIKYISDIEDEFVGIQAKAIDTEKDVVTKAFADILDMRTAGIDDKAIILKVSEHYKMPIAKVANIKNFAIQVKANHDGVLYSCSTCEASKKKAFNKVAYKKETLNKVAFNDEGVQLTSNEQMTVVDNNGNPIGTTELEQNTTLQEIQNSLGKRVFVVKDTSGNSGNAQKLMFPEGIDPELATKDVGSDISMDELEGIEAPVTSDSPDFSINEV